MRHILFLFLDGVGLGKADPETNPFDRPVMPVLQSLLGGRPLIAESAPLETQRATLLALDAKLGVSGLPQSATGQATLLNGQNVPAAIGGHYGPKPNPAVAEIVSNGNLFKHLKKAGMTTAYLNAFPPSYFEAIASGRRLYGTIALAASRAGVPLRTTDDLRQGQAISADLTAQGWRERLKLPDTPVIGYNEAGERMARLAQEVHFALFEYWLTDYAGHGQNMEAALDLLEKFDEMFGGLIENWKDEDGLIVLTSDHGNMEDLSTRRHTANPVPCLIVGSPELRRSFAAHLTDISDITPAITHFFL